LSPPAGADLRQVDVCSVSGCLPGPYCPHTKKEWIIPGVSPIARCHIHTAGGNEAWDSEAEHFFETIGLGRKSSAGALSRRLVRHSSGIGDEGGSEAEADGGEELHILPVARDVSWQTNQAATAAGASRVYWFANRDFIGSAGSGETFYWSPAPGTYTIAATDDRGQSDSVQITVEGDR
jgi:penicillin-binding protein 1C